MERQVTARRFKRQLKTRASASNVPPITENRVSTEHNDISNAKRVKFTNSESARPQISDYPKTSEYAFFKKLKEEMGGSCSRPLHEDDNNQIRSANANDPDTEISTIPSNIFKYIDRKLRSRLQSGKERPTYQFSFPSPPRRAESDNPWEIHSKDELSKTKKRAPPPCVYVTPGGKNFMLSPFPSISKNSGDEYIGKGIFPVRRHKLCQLVAKSYPEVGEGCSKGFDLVSALLNRLFPKGYENECCQSENSVERMTDTSYQLAAIPESFSEEKISTTRHTGKFKFGPCCDDDFPEYWSGCPRKRVISKWDITNSNTPLTDAAIDFQNEEMDVFFGFDVEAIEKNFLETAYSDYIYFDSYRSSCFGHLKQTDRFLYPNEFGGREPHTLLLGWDSNEEKEQHIGCALATSLNVGYQQTVGDSLNAVTMHTPSWHSNSSLGYSLPDFQSTRGRIHDEDNYAVLDGSHFLSFTPSCLTVAEDFDNFLKQNEVILHCQDDPWCIDKDSGRKGCLDALPLPRGITDDLGWKLLPLSKCCREDPSSSRIFQLPSNSKVGVDSLVLVQGEESGLHGAKNRETTLTYSEDAFGIPYWFSSNFHVSLDALLGQPLQLDYSGRGRSEDEIHFDADNQ